MSYDSELLSGILAIATDAIISVDEQQRITLFNHGAEHIFGYTADEILGQSLDRLLPERCRSGHHKLVETFAHLGDGSRRMSERSAIFGRRKSGEEFPAEASISVVESGGRRVSTVVLRDITERQRITDLLERNRAELESRVAERTGELQQELARGKQMQAALVKAQRLEAIGQLTGGVAHDFNNILTVISGNLELLEPHVTEPRPTHMLERATEAVNMAARLTNRLLSFARRSRLEPALLDLNEQVVAMSELLKRTLEEQIVLKTVLADGLWKTRADPSEVENALLNLAINGRDAMPDGGRLVIQTENTSFEPAQTRSEAGQKPGDFVRLSVTDTGTGMPPEVLARAFEPYFSTKNLGQGTGLGLSTIYGFVQQSGGFAQIYSEVGQGTTVNLYLPRAEEAANEPKAQKLDDVAFSDSGETILVVEDNEAVREAALQRLEGLGYVALEAADGEAAIKLLESGAKVDLVFSDVVMTGAVSGFDLSDWLAENHPEIGVLLTSGFAPEALQNRAHDQISLLRKPYNRQDLSRALRQALSRLPAKT